MGSMLKSDPMTYCDLFLQPETAFEILSQLGEMGCVQFTDPLKSAFRSDDVKDVFIDSLLQQMNPEVQAFLRRYILEVCRCAEMERRLRFMEIEMIKDNIQMARPKQEPKAMHPNEMVMYENILEKWEEDITEMSENQSGLLKSYLEITEMDYVLRHIGPLLGDAEIHRESLLSNRKKGQGDIGTGGRLFVMSGVVRRKRCYHFEMMLWRISRGNIYYRQATEDKILLDPYTGKEIRKVAFLAVCQGEELSSRMEKVFSGFRVNSYPCPETFQERSEMMLKVDERLTDLEQVLSTSKYQRCKALRTVARQWRSWMIQVRKAKAIYHNMNLFTLDITKNCLIGQCWVPDKDLQRVHDSLEFCSNMIGTNVPSFMLKTRTESVPPTFHRTNKFTNGFQVLINAYGDSKYRELNPGLYTIITFPFLFSLMFGDVGHAIVLLIFALWMLKYEKQYMAEKSSSEIWRIFFGGRYVILLLGIFSIYTGFIYNEVFSRSLSITKSYYVISNTVKELKDSEFIDVDASKKMRLPYMFGLDPIWPLAKNLIMVHNTVKMKISIIFGITHMILGLSLSLCNYIYFKKYYLIFLQFIPEMVFLCSLFLWLVIMIYFKWFTFSAQHPDPKKSPRCAPQILILFIDMFLMSKSKSLEQDCDAYLFEGQRSVQLVLVSLALVCIPVLLLGSPIYLYYVNKKKRVDNTKNTSNFRRYQRSSIKVQDFAEVPLSMVAFSDLMITQAVHTIEFVLSSISHTASYLRLWALSLAHAQLADMLWSMVLSKLALQDHTLVGIPKLFCIFLVWQAFTLAILVVMEGLSAFLHTLRLHWVEFMSKFYSGGGYPFQPFSFQVILSTEGEMSQKDKQKTKEVE